jgi:hypothetical protein
MFVILGLILLLIALIVGLAGVLGNCCSGAHGTPPYGVVQRGETSRSRAATRPYSSATATARHAPRRAADQP